MKTLITTLLMTAIAYATGNGGGTMQPQPAKSASSLKFNGSVQKGIILYRGETDKNVYFNIGQAKSRQWKIEQFVADKNNLAVEPKVIEALVRSKFSEGWETIEKR